MEKVDFGRCLLLCWRRGGELARLGGARECLDKEVYLVGLGIEGNYVWCFVIVVIFIGLWGAKEVGEEIFQETKGLTSFYGGWGGGCHYITLIFWNFSSSLTGYCKSLYRILFHYITCFTCFVSIDIWQIKSFYKCMYYLELLPNLLR